MVLVEAHGGACTGLGYTYGDAATGVLVRDTLAPLVEGHDALECAPPPSGCVAPAATSAARASPRWRSRPSTRRSGT